MKPPAPRPRRASPWAKELALQKAVATYLDFNANREWRWTHFPAGGARNIRTAAMLKASGLKPGWPDFILIDPTGSAHFLELKREGGKLSDPQEAFRLWCIARGLPHSVCHDLRDAETVLKHWGAVRKGDQ